MEYNLDSALYAAAPAGLLHNIRGFWQVERLQANRYTETIIPKGGIELIFNLEETPSFTAVINGTGYTMPRCFISGYNTVPIRLMLPEKQVFFGVVFHITALRKIFRMQPNDFANTCCIDITDLNKEIYNLWHCLGEARSFEERIKLFIGWLQPLMAGVCYREQLFDCFLGNTAAGLRADTLSKWLCYSPRHISRKLKELTGMNTEENLLYKKYLRGLQLMHDTTLPLTQIAYKSGFADQPHFNKTFKSFTEISPAAYRKGKSHITGHLFTDVC